jgi:hypothetical protein
MKKITTLACLLISLNGLFAQTQHSSEWSLSTSAGITSLNPLFSTNQSLKSGTGANFGLGYTHFFTAGFGFSLGLEAAMYNSSFIAADFYTRQEIATPPGLSGSFSLNSHYVDFEEKQTSLFLQLPLLLNVQIPLNASVFLYLGSGGKYLFPLSSSYKQMIRSAVISGYSDYTGQTYIDMPTHGFDTYPNIIVSSSLELKSAFLLALETGLKWKISPKTYLYTGFYMENGLTPLLNAPSKPLLGYNPASPSIYQYNSILQSPSYPSSINSLKPYAAGFKIKLAFGSGKERGRTPKVLEPKPRPLLDSRK